MAAARSAAANAKLIAKLFGAAPSSAGLQKFTSSAAPSAVPLASPLVSEAAPVTEQQVIFPASSMVQFLPDGPLISGNHQSMTTFLRDLFTNQ